MPCNVEHRPDVVNVRLAEIRAAVALAGEVSIGSALCAGEFAQAHKRLGRLTGSMLETPPGGTESG